MKKINFDLQIAGNRITNIDQLRENFHLQQVTDYFDNKVLDIWLENTNQKSILEKISKMREESDNDLVLKSIELSKKEKYLGLIKAFNMDEGDYKVIIDGLVDSDNIPIETKSYTDREIDTATKVFKKNFESYEKSKKSIPLEITSNSQNGYLDNLITWAGFGNKPKISFLDTNNLNEIVNNLDILGNVYSFIKNIDINNHFKNEIIELHKKVQPIILIKMLYKQSLREILMDSIELKEVIKRSLNLVGNTTQGEKSFIDYYEDHFNQKSNHKNYLVLKHKNDAKVLSIIDIKEIEQTEDDKDFKYIPVEIKGT